MKNSPHSWPFYGGSWLASRRVITMSAEQRGAYIQLLAVIGETESCCIPDDDSELAELTKLYDRWPEQGRKVLACFMPCPEHPGHITNDKLWGVRQEQIAFQEKQRDNGARGAAKRWGRNGQPIGSPSRANSSQSLSLPFIESPIGPALRSALPASEVLPALPVLSFPDRPSGQPAHREQRRPAPRSRICPEGFTLTDALRDYAVAQGLAPDEIDSEWESFRLYEFKDPKTDWARAWQRWVRTGRATRPLDPRQPRPTNAAARSFANYRAAFGVKK